VFNTEKEAPVHVRSSARISRYRDAPSRETGEVDKRASRAGEASTADARADLAGVSVVGDKKSRGTLNAQPQGTNIKD
jgi:hypothetical protein